MVFFDGQLVFFKSLICFKLISLSLENTEVLLVNRVVWYHLSSLIAYAVHTRNLFRSALIRIFFCSLIQRWFMGITFLHTKAPVLRELAPGIKYLNDNIHLHSILETSTFVKQNFYLFNVSVKTPCTFCKVHIHS